MSQVTAKVDSTVIASSEQTVVVEGNHYFPPESVNKALLKPNSKQTVCHWKGTANYYDIVVADKSLEAAAWYYPKPLLDAVKIKDYIAFYPVVEVTSK